MGKHFKPKERSVWKFDDLIEMKELANFLSTKLITDGKEHLASEVDEFSYNTSATSSEYLKGFRTALYKVLQEDAFPDRRIKQTIQTAIEAINSLDNDLENKR